MKPKKIRQLLKSLKPGEVVYLEWDDAIANTNTAWNDDARAWMKRTRKSMSVLQAGFFMDYNRQRVVLASRLGSSQTGGLFAVPTACIRKVRRMKWITTRYIS